MKKLLFIESLRLKDRYVQLWIFYIVKWKNIKIFKIRLITFYSHCLSRSNAVPIRHKRDVDWAKTSVWLLDKLFNALMLKHFVVMKNRKLSTFLLWKLPKLRAWSNDKSLDPGVSLMPVEQDIQWGRNYLAVIRCSHDACKREKFFLVYQKVWNLLVYMVVRLNFWLDCSKPKIMETHWKKFNLQNLFVWSVIPAYC